MTTEVITPGAIITPIMAGEMARELIAAAGSARPGSPHPATVAAPGVVTPAPITTPKLRELVTPESNRSVATSLGAAPAFGEVSRENGIERKTRITGFRRVALAGSRRSRALVVCAERRGIKRSRRASDSAGSGQQASTASGQPATPERSATVSPSTSPAAAESLPASNKPWGIIPDQTSGVADAANALGAADRQMAVISPRGQLALEYREGKFFGDGNGADLRVYGPEQGRVSYLIFVRNNPAVEWERIGINRRGFRRGEAGHDMGHHASGRRAR